MYKEIGEFIWSVGFDRRLYKDGEFWTSVLIGGAMGTLFHFEPAWVNRIRDHFGDLLSVTSIVFGFVLSTLFFYIQAAGTWSRDDKVKAVANALVDHHVWTVVSLLALIGYILVLWLFGTSQFFNQAWLAVLYGLLVFLCCYCGLQVLNQVLTVRWAFKKQSRLLAPPQSEQQSALSKGDSEGNSKS